MTADAALLVTYVLGALSVSFLCSILEATLLSVRVTELQERSDDGDAGAALLLELKRERVDDAISAILILNTIAHTIGATLAGAQAAEVFGSAYVGVFSAVLTLLVLVCTEIIPKTLGTVYASRLVAFVARTIKILTTGLAPILALTRILTRLIASEEHRPISRGEVTALVAMAVREGAIKSQESRLFENVLALEQVKVEDVMTPRTVVSMLHADATVEDLVKSRENAGFSRVPLYTENRDQVVGYVLQREVLAEAACGGDRSQPLRAFKREVPFIIETMPLARALRTFLDQREQLAMVVDEFGGVSGLVTLEDLVETILGVEIVDESDRVVDMRGLAVDLRDRRLARHQPPLQPAEDGSPS